MAELIWIEDSIKDAILTIMKYIEVATGVEPTQDEIAEMLKSYFILNEIGNQVKYQLKKASENKDDKDHVEIRGPFWTLNLMTGPGKNVLTKGGVFTSNIQAAVRSVSPMNSRGSTACHRVLGLFGSRRTSWKAISSPCDGLPVVA